jgi:hypothetical protein
VLPTPGKCFQPNLPKIGLLAKKFDRTHYPFIKVGFQRLLAKKYNKVEFISVLNSLFLQINYNQGFYVNNTLQQKFRPFKKKSAKNSATDSSGC